MCVDPCSDRATGLAKVVEVGVKGCDREPMGAQGFARKRDQHGSRCKPETKYTEYLDSIIHVLLTVPHSAREQ